MATGNCRILKAGTCPWRHPLATGILYLASLIMTTEQVNTVRASWNLVLPRASKFTDLLYEEFFALEPQLRMLFEASMEVQHVKLVGLISSAMERLDDPEDLKRSLRALGERHVTYGAKHHHYRSLKSAWMSTLERMLGDGCTEEVSSAWGAFYDLLQEGMTAGTVETTMPQGSNDA
jgi:hemoglobin-like flavoprotein